MSVRFVLLSTMLTQLGGYCGATSVTRAFVKWCHETFGPAFEAISLSERGASSKFIEEFERKLKSFRGDEDEENKFDVPLPTLAKQLKAHKIQTSEYDFGERTVIISMYSVPRTLNS